MHKTFLKSIQENCCLFT